MGWWMKSLPSYFYHHPNNDLSNSQQHILATNVIPVNQEFLMSFPSFPILSKCCPKVSPHICSIDFLRTSHIFLSFYHDLPDIFPSVPYFPTIFPKIFLHFPTFSHEFPIVSPIFRTFSRCPRSGLPGSPRAACVTARSATRPWLWSSASGRLAPRAERCQDFTCRLGDHWEFPPLGMEYHQWDTWEWNIINGI